MTKAERSLRLGAAIEVFLDTPHRNGMVDRNSPAVQHLKDCHAKWREHPPMIPMSTTSKTAHAYNLADTARNVLEHLCLPEKGDLPADNELVTALIEAHDAWMKNRPIIRSTALKTA